MPLIKPVFVLRKKSHLHTRLELKDEKSSAYRLIPWLALVNVSFGFVDWILVPNESPFIFFGIRIFAVFLSRVCYLLSRGRAKYGMRLFLTVAPYIFGVEVIMIWKNLILSPYFSGITLVMITSTMLFPVKAAVAGIAYSICLLPLLSWTLLFHGTNPSEIVYIFSMGLGSVLVCMVNSGQVHKDIKDKLSISELLKRNIGTLEKKNEELSSALELLKTAQANLIQNEKLASLGTLAAGIAHELNNAINFASGAIRPIERYIEQFPPSVEKEKIKPLFSSMKKGINLSIDIIKNLKNYSAQEKSEFTHISLLGVLQTVLAILKSRIKDEKVILEIPPDLEVFANHGGMNQLCMNLISNAIDALNGQGTLRIHAQNGENTWELVIGDDGPGMTPEVQRKIFDPFFTTKEVGKGTGLGLFVVHKEIERHHGQITVESEIGKGTIFRCRFPHHIPI